jgi:hypothetical protein
VKHSHIRRAGLGAALLAAVALQWACGGNSAMPTEPSHPIVIGQLQITKVEAMVGTSLPYQVTLKVTGQLPDACTQIAAISQQRNGQNVEVTVQTSHELGIACILIYPAPTVLTVPLDGGFAPGSYTIRVNDASLDLTL